MHAAILLPTAQVLDHRAINKSPKAKPRAAPARIRRVFGSPTQLATPASSPPPGHRPPGRQSSAPLPSCKGPAMFKSISALAARLLRHRAAARLSSSATYTLAFEQLEP